MHVLGFIIRIYHDAWSHERQLLLCLIETNMFIIVFQIYNKTGCPLQKKLQLTCFRFFPGYK